MRTLVSRHSACLSALAANFREPIWLGPIGPAAQVHVLSALLAFGLFSIAGLHAPVPPCSWTAATRKSPGAA